MTTEEVTRHWGDARVIDMTYTQALENHTTPIPDFYWEGSSTQKVAHDSMGTVAITINPGRMGGNSYAGEGIVDVTVDSVSYHIRYGKAVTVPQVVKNVLVNAGYDVT